MNRDAIVATLIGIVIGILVAGAVLVGPKIPKYFAALKLPSLNLPKSVVNNTGNTNATSKTEQNQKGPITIESPLADSIITENEILVSGFTKGNAIVIISGPSTDETVTADGNGKFAGNVTLGEGTNIVHVTSVSEETIEAGSIRIYHTNETF